MSILPCERSLHARARAELLVELEDVFGIVREEQRRGLFTEPQFVEISKAFAGRPEWMVRTEEHLVAVASTHVVDKVFWISGDLISRCVDKYVRVLHHE